MKVSTHRLRNFLLAVTVVTAANLFTACPLLFSQQKEKKIVDFTPSVLQVGATYVDITAFTEEEKESLKDYTIGLYRQESDYRVNIIYSATEETVTFTNLEQNKDYVVKIDYTTTENEYIKKEVSFKTGIFDFSDFSLEYRDSAVYFNTRENIKSFCWYMVALRSDSADGDYASVEVQPDVNSIYYNRVTESNKTYWYKIQLIDKNREVLYSLDTPLSCTTGIAAPSYIKEASIKVLNGITGAKFEWDAVSGAEWYIVDICNSSYSSSGDIIAEKRVDENSFEFNAANYIDNFEPSAYKNYNLRVRAANEAGSSSTTYKTFSLPTPRITKVDVIPGQKEVEYRVTTNFDYVMEGCSIHYHVRETYKDDSGLLAESDEPVFTRTGLKIGTEYSTYSYRNLYSGYVNCDISYTDKNGTEHKLQASDSDTAFCTLGFDAVQNLSVSEVKSTSVLLSFDELSDEQKDGQNVFYHAFAFVNGSQKFVRYNIKSPYTFTGLDSGIEYNFKVIASNNDTSLTDSDTNFAEIQAATDSGLSAPVISRIYETASIIPIYTKLHVEWNKITEDDGTGNVAYEVEYKVLKKSAFKSHFLHRISASEIVSAYINEYVAEADVNGGNRYLVRVAAYKVDEPACRVYSEVSEYQAGKIDDKTLVTALTYPENNEMGLPAGDVVDFSEPKVWTNGKAPRSNMSQGYNIGLTQFMGSAAEARFKIPTGEAEYFAFKISFDSTTSKGIDSSYTPRLIFLDDSAFSLGTGIRTYGAFDKIFIVEPDTMGTFLEQYGKDKTIFEDTNMPWFSEQNGKITSSVSVNSAGIEIQEGWLFNNAVYVGVKQNVAGDLGFSYFF